MKQRIIKFRAWTGAMMEYKVVAGALGAFFVAGLDPADTACMSPFNTIYSDQVPVMQFTGLLDSKGHEIYEGDLFGKFGGDKERPNEYEIHGQIKFDNDFAMFVIELTNGGWMELFDYMKEPKREREVIGNVHENPELLKQQ